MAAGLAAAAGPALAQTASELTVIGRYGSDANAPRLSAAVSYADLDLTTGAGRDMLRERVRLTAQDLCRRLGESNSSGGALTASCEQDAMNNAREQVNLAFASAMAAPRSYAAAPPAAEPAPVGQAADVSAIAPDTSSQPATVTVQTVTNGPVPDTVENRQRYGGPMSNGGRRTDPAGN
jgi:UrcA family protein